MKRYYSRGKLMLTGEYLVLTGAQSLALPLIYGQDLSAERVPTEHLQWTSYDYNGNTWFEGLYNPEKAAWEKASDLGTADILQGMLRECVKMNSVLRLDGWKIETRLEFDRKWGWGSSSTLINNMAQWALVDAFTLSERTLGGSGYDIACAQSVQPILYKIEKGKGVFEAVNWQPPFSRSIFFAFTGKKRDSRQATAQFDRNRDYSAEVQQMDLLTRAMMRTADVKEFERLTLHHEALVSEVLGQKTVQKEFFQDFPGAIKSLGAWGGDFIMAVSQEEEASVRNYFRSKELDPVFRFDEIISQV
ncbi:MAG TPA: GYDIA family GHMP kinase [Saprospiraceae bacterium]|nr:GYDIA family GHMP kinase [Saprospiraceae bacterium]